MDSLDLQVLNQARDWFAQGHKVWLVTVIETWGSAPRPPGALLCLRDDGQVAGSVSGGCVEDDLIDRLHHGERVAMPSLIAYGVTKEEAARFGLPCGGNLRLVQEPLQDVAWIDEVLARTARHELVARRLDLATGRVTVDSASRGDAFSFDGQRLVALFGRPAAAAIRLYAITADDRAGLLRAATCDVDAAYPALTPDCLPAHWFERELAEQWGVTPAGHPWLKPLRYHAAYRPGRDAWERAAGSACPTALPRPRHTRSCARSSCRRPASRSSARRGVPARRRRAPARRPGADTPAQSRGAAPSRRNTGSGNGRAR